MVTQYPKLDVIAVGAHPDDVEIACGGTLAMLSRQGYRVGIVDLTDGEPTPLSPGPEVRRAEAAAAAEVLGIHERVILDLPNRRLMDNFDSRVALAKEFRKFRPDIVIGFGGKTPLASPDHLQATNITDAAVFYSRLTKWDEFFDGLPVHTISSQLYFHLAVDPNSFVPSQHQIVIDIDESLEAKIESILCYKTQFPPEKRSIVDRVRSAAIVSGGHAHFKAGESFVSARAIGARDLVQAMLAHRK